MRLSAVTEPLSRDAPSAERGCSGNASPAVVDTLQDKRRCCLAQQFLGDTSNLPASRGPATVGGNDEEISWNDSRQKLCRRLAAAELDGKRDIGNAESIRMAREVGAQFAVLGS